LSTVREEEQRFAALEAGRTRAGDEACATYELLTVAEAELKRLRDPVEQRARQVYTYVNSQPDAKQPAVDQAAAEAARLRAEYDCLNGMREAISDRAYSGLAGSFDGGAAFMRLETTFDRRRRAHEPPGA